VLIEYSDFECPFCARHASETFDLIQREFVVSGRVQYVFRNYPIEELHASAMKAAQAAACAHDQGKFTELRSHLFERRRMLAQLDWTQTASTLGLNASQFDRCLTQAQDADIRAEKQEGARLGVSSTPTFLVGTLGENHQVAIEARLRGAAPYSVFREYIERSISANGKGGGAGQRTSR
jgi:protein-disulfide isomerase